MRILNLVLAAVTGAAAVPRELSPRRFAATNATIPLFSQKTIWNPPSGKSSNYARYFELLDGSLLVTSATSGYSQGIFPVFKSTDEGATWTWISNITDQVNGVGFAAQPTLWQLDEADFGYPAGTVFASGNSWKQNAFTKIDLYVSTDLGQTWKFLSHVAQGGGPDTNNGKTPVWEPFIYVYNHTMIVYYSDQRDSKHGQKLSQQTSTDLKNWGSAVDTVAYSTYIDRPGMVTVAYIATMNKYILTHEFPAGSSSTYGANYPVYYRISDSPLTFASATGTPILVNGKAPSAGPYVAWSSVGGANGTIFVSDSTYKGVFTNSAGGDKNQWQYHDVPQPSSYSRALHIFNNNPNRLFIVGGSPYGGNAPLGFSTVDVTNLLATKTNF